MTTATLARVEGLTPTAACTDLHQYASLVPADQAIVEVGVYKARSACWLAAGAQAGHGAHVYAIDPWDLPGERGPFLPVNNPGRHRVQFTHATTRRQAHDNVRRAGLTDHITLIQGFSTTVGNEWDGPTVGLMYIDGDHNEAAVHADVAAWRSHLAADAIVCFDDYQPRYEGVFAAVNSMVEAGELTIVDVRHGRLAITKHASQVANSVR